MSFEANLTTAERTATIRLTGELDATTAPVLRSLIERVGQVGAERLLLEMDDLSYMSSAGIRCLVFAHQTVPADIVLMDVQPDVAEVIRLAGFDRAVTFASRTA